MLFTDISDKDFNKAFRSIISCELVAVLLQRSVMADKERTVRVGRPRLPGSAKYVRLCQSVFNLWRERKDSLGKFTDSEFAEYLLHRR